MHEGKLHRFNGGVSRDLKMAAPSGGQLDWSIHGNPRFSAVAGRRN